jgi:hypothetical protein
LFPSKITKPVNHHFVLCFIQISSQNLMHTQGSALSEITKLKCNNHAWLQNLTNSDKHWNEIQPLLINCPSTLHKITEKWRSHICSSRSLKSCKYKSVCICNNKSGYVPNSCVLAHCSLSNILLSPNTFFMRP